ncbi:hypothetical protein OBBRIDRAFT_342877 [Obba rivulosa]|uniref:Uncharacterized protein n=1 Tax=Obba rivulosa TaxID=1052685 RepID=A0A8E2AIC9_9APHY|nr:hypothetical protein OBBRIDRAFT_342877 [Obba rivulosa]
MSSVVLDVPRGTEQVVLNIQVVVRVTREPSSDTEPSSLRQQLADLESRVAELSNELRTRLKIEQNSDKLTEEMQTPSSLDPAVLAARASGAPSLFANHAAALPPQPIRVEGDVTPYPPSKRGSPPPQLAPPPGEDLAHGLTPSSTCDVSASPARVDASTTLEPPPSNPVPFWTGVSWPKECFAAVNLKKSIVVLQDDSTWDNYPEHVHVYRPSRHVSKDNIWGDCFNKKLLRDKIEIVMTQGNEWSYLGTYEGSSEGIVSLDEFANISEVIQRRLISLSGHKRQHTRLQQMYNTGEITASKFSLRRVGFDNTLYSQLLEAGGKMA